MLAQSLRRLATWIANPRARSIARTDGAAISRAAGVGQRVGPTEDGACTLLRTQLTHLFGHLALCLLQLLLRLPAFLIQFPLQGRAGLAHARILPVAHILAIAIVRDLLIAPPGDTADVAHVHYRQARRQVGHR